MFVAKGSKQVERARCSLVSTGCGGGALQFLLQGIGIVEYPKNVRLTDARDTKERPTV